MLCDDNGRVPMAPTDESIRTGRYRVQVADLVTLRSRGKLYWDTIGDDVSWATADSMAAHERAAGGSARIVDLATGELVPEQADLFLVLFVGADAYAGVEVIS
jgi:hypothetical protein